MPTATSTTDRYARPADGVQWNVPGSFETTFRWEYQDGRDSLLKLYEKGKERQWDADTRIDWSQDLDPENPEQLPDESIPIFGSPTFERLTPAEKATLRRHFQSWQLSQFLHGEQGALICTAKIVQQVPSIDAKFYAATQVIDEARHVEAYSRLLHDKFELAYPITPTLKRLLDDVLSDSRWDMTYLGMQVLIEGLALAAFAQIRDQSQNPLAASVNAYVMQDEARHVAFGRFALRDYYPTLTQAERDEREEFAVEACYLMRDRFQAEEVWETLGLPVDECAAYMLESGFMQRYRSALFSRIVPVIKDIGLWGPKIRKGYEQMGILGYADVDVAGDGRRGRAGGRGVRRPAGGGRARRAGGMTRRRLKMRDLERATGVGRETIRFYIREGLLPEPERPGRNVAWYDESFVDRIALIKELQRKRFLPLQAIKALVRSDAPPSRAEVDALLAIDGTLYRGLAARRRLASARSPSAPACRSARSAAWRTPGPSSSSTRQGAQWLEGDAIRFVERWAALRRAGYAEQLGFRPENMRLYVDFVRWLAREELRMFAHGVTGRVDAEVASGMAEQGIEIVNELIALIRKATLLRYIAEGNVPEADAPAPRTWTSQKRR